MGHLFFTRGINALPTMALMLICASSPVMKPSEFGDLKGWAPCQNRLYRSSRFVTMLSPILGADLKSYKKHLSFSGCGEIERTSEVVAWNLSQLHVGGYTSYVIFDRKSQQLYVFWLKQTVRDKKWQLYGKKPVPPSVLDFTTKSLNINWGHVAHFTFVGEDLHIDLHH